VASDDDETPVSPPVVLDRPGRYEITPIWASDEMAEFSGDVTIPASVVRLGQTYRVRCRMKDSTGRWSHWSAPVQFEAGDAIAQGTAAYLRITELMYNPTDAADDSDANNDDFEFIELKNVGPDTLDLSSVSFTNGVAFHFGDSDVTTLGPGAFVLVVKSRAAFESRYGSQLSSLIAGEYSGRLSNGGEEIRLEDFWNGTILEFEYRDDWHDLTDGRGHSLVVVDPVGTDAGDWGLEDTWQASASVDGSPGAD